MILRSIEFEHTGPFSAPTKLEVDERVTVLTGPNDAGKTCALLAILHALQESSFPRQLTNPDRADLTGPWPKTNMPRTRMLFAITPRDIQQEAVDPQCRKGDCLEVMFPKKDTRASVIRSVNSRNPKKTRARHYKLPSVLSFVDSYSLRDTIPLDDLRPHEQALMQMGFGPAWDYNFYRELDLGRRHKWLKDAENAINSHLRDALPRTLPIEICLVERTDREIGVCIKDQHGGYVAASFRGAGAQRILSLIGLLLSLKEKEPTVVLFDEPELSLHPDSQHRLRRLLEELADRPLVQVLYATHSPAMINNMRPESVRVFSRSTEGEHATTKIVNDAFQDSFLLVRSSLGMSPADSLLYAPVIVVVEGPTEVRALPTLLVKLQKAGVEGFKDAEDLLSQARFFDGQGDRSFKICRLLQAQNIRPILLLDGDKEPDAAELESKCGNARLVLLPTNTEVEELLTEEIYMHALARVKSDTDGQLTAAAFSKWRSGKGYKKFTKAVYEWLCDVGLGPLDKPKTMYEAVRNLKPSGIESKVNVEPLKKLMAAMRDASTA